MQAAVPFLWEERPGRPKHLYRSRSFGKELYQHDDSARHVLTACNSLKLPPNSLKLPPRLQHHNISQNSSSPCPYDEYVITASAPHSPSIVQGGSQNFGTEIRSFWSSKSPGITRLSPTVPRVGKKSCPSLLQLMGDEKFGTPSRGGQTRKVSLQELMQSQTDAEKKENDALFAKNMKENGSTNEISKHIGCKRASDQDLWQNTYTKSSESGTALQVISQPNRLRRKVWILNLLCSAGIR